MLDHEPKPLEGVVLLVVDEAQDLTPQQWRYVRKIAKNVPKIILAGDDDQAIYEWAGADPLGMLRFNGNVRVLPQSHRLTAAGHRLAEKITGGMVTRQPKKWQGRIEAGRVETIQDVGETDLHDSNWLMLARHRYQLQAMEKEARRQGVPYQTLDGKSSLDDDCVRAVVHYERLRAGGTATSSQVRQMMPFLGQDAPAEPRSEWTWITLGMPEERQPWLEGMPHISLEDREYIRAVRRRNYSLKMEPRVRLQTIHGAKGWEANNVVMCTDVARTTQIDSDAERRVAYVGATRAKESLYLTRRTSPWGWDLI